MESELTHYMLIFAGAFLFLVAVVVAIFVIAMLREMRLKAEETVLARNGFQLDAVVIRHHLQHVTPVNGLPVSHPLPEKITEDTPVTRIPKPLYVSERPTQEMVQRQQRSVEVPAITVEPARTRHAG